MLGRSARASLILGALLISPAFAAGVPPGAGTLVFGDVPVAPSVFPDYSPHRFGLRGGGSVAPQTFSFATYADSKSLMAWYQQHLVKQGWRIEQHRNNYPVPGANALVASRKGEAVTVIIEGGRGGSRVSIIKLNSSK